jgi:hypothetical protein
MLGMHYGTQGPRLMGGSGWNNRGSRTSVVLSWWRVVVWKIFLVVAAVKVPVIVRVVTLGTRGLRSKLGMQ